MKKHFILTKFSKILILSLVLLFPIVIYSAEASIEFTIDLADCTSCNICPALSIPPNSDAEIILGLYGAYFVNGTKPTAPNQKSRLIVTKDAIKTVLYACEDACPQGAITSATY